MNKKGFTLIELLAVIIILAIVALIATPIILNVVEDAKKSVGQSESNMILKGVIDYCQKENMGFETTSYCQSGETIKQNIDKMVNLGNVNKDSINITLDENGNLTNLTLKSNGNCFELIDGKMELTSSFAIDSWNTIQNNIKNGKTDMYNVGDIKTITLTSSTITPKEGENIKLEKTLKVRIANKSTNECQTEQKGFSQTACGFVVEFVDIITEYNMNPRTPEYQFGTNKGGWPASDMYKLLNNPTNSIFSVLPDDLKNVIIDTYTVSGYGSEEINNFTSDNNLNKEREKLYLLSTREVWGKLGETNTIEYDTADKESVTRQLDYYKNNSVSTDNKEGAIKNYQGSAAIWWLRSAHSNYDYSFFLVLGGGNWAYNQAYTTYGVAPAFRIG